MKHEMRIFKRSSHLIEQAIELELLFGLKVAQAFSSYALFLIFLFSYIQISYYRLVLLNGFCFRFMTNKHKSQI